MPEHKNVELHITGTGAGAAEQKLEQQSRSLSSSKEA